MTMTEGTRPEPAATGAAPRLLSIQVSLPREVSAEESPDPGGKSWTTGFFKRAVEGPLWLDRINLAGDGQGDRKNHGGPDKAVLAYAGAHYPLWRTELDWPDVPHGAFGENFTVQGLDEGTVCIGDVYEIGGVVVQVAQPRMPCWKISARWRRPGLLERVEATGRTGWYLRVLWEGTVQAGDTLRLTERPHAGWTVTAATAVMRARHDIDGARRLAACPALAEVWRDALQKRVSAASA